MEKEVIQDLILRYGVLLGKEIQKDRKQHFYGLHKNSWSRQAYLWISPVYLHLS